MHTNIEGLSIIQRFEGYRANPYLCPAHVWTIGYGSTRLMNGKPVKPDTSPVSEKEATELLVHEVNQTERQVVRLVRVGVTINEFSALASFVYNVGSGNFAASTMRQKLNRGDYAGAANEFWKWRRGGGRVLSGLVRRRKAEKDLFTTEV